ncbi:hypothetical protein ABZY58_00130 [Micromonospora tulbaghiae]|uniref:hypothetical protein n=1 Tax=Micromonospora tulbaghiae TaxID=479978 RepID=UPI0033AD553C
MSATAERRRPAGGPSVTEPPTASDAPSTGAERPKRTRRASAAKKATPVAKKAAPAVKKTARKASSPKPEASPREPEAPVEPTFTASEPPPAEREPDGTQPVAAEEPATAPRPGRTRRPVKAAPAAEKVSPAKRAKRAAPAAAATASETTTVSATEPAAPEPAASESEPTAADQAPQAEPAVAERTPEAEPAVAERTPGRSGIARTPVEGWRAVGPQLRDHPGFAPELLALAAVDALGPRARDWVEQVRRAYPGADADGVARLATRRFVRMAGTGGALAAGAGLFAPVAELAAVLWTQANLVLHLAAAYGRDPAHPDRAAELLVLTLVHPDDGTARAALAAARAADGPADGPWGRVAEAAWRLATPVAAQAGGWLGLRLAARLLPGAAALAAATGGTATAERVAARAVARYRPTRARSTPGGRGDVD